MTSVVMWLDPQNMQAVVNNPIQMDPVLLGGKERNKNVIYIERKNKNVWERQCAPKRDSS